MKRLDLIAIGLTLACAGGDRNTIVTDSAGVRLITNQGADTSWQGTSRWTIVVPNDAAFRHQAPRARRLDVGAVRGRRFTCWPARTELPDWNSSQ